MKPDALEVFVNDATSLNPVIHSQARFIILNILNAVDSCDAGFLIESIRITWGNFSTHMARLEAEGYVSSAKDFDNRRPRTRFAITELGRNELEAYIKTMRSILGMVE